MNKRAFTLVELLVVIAIIAILTSLVAGLMARARGRGEATLCASNLRQLVGANIAFAADHEGIYVPAQDQSNTVRWHGVRSGISGKFDGDRGPLAPYLGHEGRVKLCPTLRHVLNGGASFEDGTGGYGYNAAYIGGSPDAPFTPARIVAVTRPANTMMFADTAFARASGLQEYAYAEPWKTETAGHFRNPLSASVHFRHEGFANVAWCDGHLSQEPPTKIDGTNLYGGDSAKWQLGWFGPSEKNGNWRPWTD